MVARHFCAKYPIIKTHGGHQELLHPISFCINVWKPPNVSLENMLGQKCLMATKCFSYHLLPPQMSRDFSCQNEWCNVSLTIMNGQKRWVSSNILLLVYLSFLYSSKIQTIIYTTSILSWVNRLCPPLEIYYACLTFTRYS